jgi:hypothetical protein
MGAHQNTGLENFALSGITLGLSLTLGIGVVSLVPSLFSTKVQSNPVILSKQPLRELAGDKPTGANSQSHMKNRAVQDEQEAQPLPPGAPESQGPTSGTAKAKPEDKLTSIPANERAQRIMQSKISTERPMVSNYQQGRKGWVVENMSINYYRDQCAGEGIKVKPGGAAPVTESVHKAEYDASFQNRQH